MKSCDIREANTSWAAATLIKVSGRAKGATGTVAVAREVTGMTGPVVSGGGTVFTEVPPLPQQAAR